MTIGEPILPRSSGTGLDTEWQCPEHDCPYVELGKADFPLGDGVCHKYHPHRRLVKRSPHG